MNRLEVLTEVSEDWYAHAQWNYIIFTVGNQAHLSASGQ